MAGNEKDMLCYPESDRRDVYVVKRDVFDMTYERTGIDESGRDTAWIS